jgi:hypothetical protein
MVNILQMNQLILMIVIDWIYLPEKVKPMSIAHQRKWHTKLVVSKDLNYNISP